MAFDLALVGGTVVDGTGAPGVGADVAVAGDRVVAVRRLEPHEREEASEVLDATGLVVCPGFVNVLSHAYVTVLRDPRSLSDLVQGVTTEVFGEGHSMGPWNERQAAGFFANGRNAELEERWSRLSEYLAFVERRGTSQNVCSFVGATTVREHVVGWEDRAPTAAELDHMAALVAEEVTDGALGVGSALIYPPGHYAGTDELVALCRAAGRHGGGYASHLRSEADRLLGGVGELVEIARRAGVWAELWHLKAAGRSNWHRLGEAIGHLEAARSSGVAVSADVYPYTAAATNLAAAIPPRYCEGGADRLAARLADPSLRERIAHEIRTSETGWENLYLAAGGGDGIVVLSAGADATRHHQGRTLADIATEQGTDPVEVVLDLVAANGFGATAAWFLVSGENLERALALPWVAVGSDGASVCAEGRVLDTPVHPRTYGTFARVLGHFCRDRGLLTLAEAVHRLSGLPAATLGLVDRGTVREGAFADLVVLDPDRVADRATFREPHRYATGVHHVVVNGTVTLRDGSHTGRFAGRALAGGGR